MTGACRAQGTSRSARVETSLGSRRGGKLDASRGACECALVLALVASALERALGLQVREQCVCGPAAGRQLPCRRARPPTHPPPLPLLTARSLALSRQKTPGQAEKTTVVAQLLPSVSDSAGGVCIVQRARGRAAGETRRRACAAAPLPSPAQLARWDLAVAEIDQGLVNPGRVAVPGPAHSPRTQSGRERCQRARGLCSR